MTNDSVSDLDENIRDRVDALSGLCMSGDDGSVQSAIAVCKDLLLVIKRRNTALRLSK